MKNDQAEANFQSYSSSVAFSFRGRPRFLGTISFTPPSNFESELAVFFDRPGPRVVDAAAVVTRFALPRTFIVVLVFFFAFPFFGFLGRPRFGAATGAAVFEVVLLSLVFFLAVIVLALAGRPRRLTVAVILRSFMLKDFFDFFDFFNRAVKPDALEPESDLRLRPTAKRLSSSSCSSIPSASSSSTLTI
jgi:hypothetical protein